MTYRKAGFLLLIPLLAMCSQAILTPSPGSNIVFMGANPTFIAANGDVSIISVLVIDGTGNPVPDGSVVQFFTNLGRIPEQGKTNDGVARVNLVSDGRNGTATVTAIIGGGSSGGGTPSPSPSSGSIGSPVAGSASALSVTGPSVAAATTATTETVTVTIGSAVPDHVVLTANPPRITTGGSTLLLAQVFDASGNPAVNVPVIFQITSTAVQGRLDSGGRTVFTDNDGRATDILRTNSTVAGDIIVTATTANGKTSNSLTVPVFITTP